MRSVWIFVVISGMLSIVVIAMYALFFSLSAAHHDEKGSRFQSKLDDRVVATFTSRNKVKLPQSYKVKKGSMKNIRKESSIQFTPLQKRLYQQLRDAYDQASQSKFDVHNQDNATTSRRFATNKTGIRDAINSQMPNIQACYESWAKLNPNLGGRISTHFVIKIPDNGSDDHAQVDEVSVQNGKLGNVFLEGCILSHFSELIFDIPPNGKLDVTYPLNFQRGNAEEKSD